MKSLLNELKLIPEAGAATAATTDLDGSVIDMAQDGGYAAILGIAQLGDVTTGCVLEFTLRGSNAADGSNSVQLSTTGAVTADATSADNKLLVLDHVQPMYRYVFHRLKRGTANAVVNGLVAGLYQANSGAIPDPDRRAGEGRGHRVAIAKPKTARGPGSDPRAARVRSTASGVRSSNRSAFESAS